MPNALYLVLFLVDKEAASKLERDLLLQVTRASYCRYLTADQTGSCECASVHSGGVQSALSLETSRWGVSNRRTTCHFTRTGVINV